MKKNLLWIFLIPTIIKANMTIPPLIKDPFISTTSLSCEDLEMQYIQQLKAWQYCGYITETRDDKISTAVIQMVNTKQWLPLSDNQPPALLLPWKIADISALLIKWQLDLPSYCDKRLTLIMPIQGK